MLQERFGVLQSRFFDRVFLCFDLRWVRAEDGREVLWPHSAVRVATVLRVPTALSASRIQAVSIRLLPASFSIVFVCGIGAKLWKMKKNIE